IEEVPRDQRVESNGRRRRAAEMRRLRDLAEHTGDRAFVTVADGDRPAQRAVVAEKSPSRFLRQHYASGTIQRVARIAGDERQVEDLEKRGVDGGVAEAQRAVVGAHR